MKIITFDTEEHVFNDFEILTKTERGDHRRYLHLQRGDYKKNSKNFKRASNPFKLSGNHLKIFF